MPDTAASAAHRVRRLRWQARASSPVDAFALRRVLHGGSEAVHTALEQACAAAMREAGDADAVWRVPRLLLRIDAADLGRLETELPGRVALALRDALGAAGVGRTAATGASGAAPASNSAAAAAAHAIATSSAAHERTSLLHYLATGGLDWPLAGLGADAAQAVLTRAATHALHALWAGGLRLDDVLPGPADAIAERLGALGRWLQLLPAGLRQRWLATSPAPAGIVAPLRDAWLAAMAASPSTAPAATAAAIVEWQALWLAWGALPQPTGPLQSAAEFAAAPALRAWVMRLTAATHPSTPVAAPPAEPADFPHALLQALRPTRNAPAAQTLVLRPVPLATDSAATLLVPLAGLVLLHPFLPRLLAGCGVLDDAGRGIAEAHLPRACALLHALACGDGAGAAFEYQLPLVKLLLGQAPDVPLATAPPALTAPEQDEVAALLDAVRDHWTGLRGTGVEGLRLSFLQRRGLLRRGEGAWQLTMQTEAFDLLMGLLPWSISLVKLPWMRQPLMVDWPSAP